MELPWAMVHRSTEIEKMAYNQDVSDFRFIIDNISECAARFSQKIIGEEGKYGELIAELNSMAHGSEPELALNILKGIKS